MTKWTLNQWFNFIAFQALWPLCVIGAAHETLWPGIVLASVMLCWHGFGVSRCSDLQLAAIALCAGYLLDSLWINLDFLRFSAPWPMPQLAPVWIAVLWIGFGLSINHSLAWMTAWPRLCSALLMLLAPFSYFCAERLGAVEILAQPWEMVLYLGGTWSVLVYLLLFIAKYGLPGLLPKLRSTSEMTP